MKNRSFKYRLYPNEKQKDAINVIFNNCNFVRKQYQKDYYSKQMPKLLKDVLTEYKEQYPHLKETDSLALMNALFKESDKFQAGKSESIQRVKKSYATANFKYADCFKIVDYNHIYLPKVGNVKITIHRPFPQNSRMRETTIIKEADGKYFASIDFEIYEFSEEKHLDINKSIGLDYSSTHFVVDSNGKKFDIPHFYRDNLDRIVEMRKAQERCEKGSTNYYKKQNEIIKLHKKIQRTRMDYLHKLSTELVNTYDYICIEDINLSKIQEKRNLKNPTKDNAYGEFVKMLRYKARDKGKKIVTIDKWYPSTKRCHVCGHINNEIKLGEKEWTCSFCKTNHDRDVNAAINILNEGLKTYR